MLELDRERLHQGSGGIGTHLSKLARMQGAGLDGSEGPSLLYRSVPSLPHGDPAVHRLPHPEMERGVCPAAFHSAIFTILFTYLGSFQLSHRDSVTGRVSQPSPYPEELSELGIGVFTSLVSRVLVPI